MNIQAQENEIIPLALACGEGAEAELMEGALRLLSESGLPFSIENVEIGEGAFRRGNAEAITPSALRTLQCSRVLLTSSHMAARLAGAPDVTAMLCRLLQLEVSEYGAGEARVFSPAPLPPSISQSHLHHGEVVEVHFANTISAQKALMGALNTSREMGIVTDGMLRPWRIVLEEVIRQKEAQSRVRWLNSLQALEAGAPRVLYAQDGAKLAEMLAFKNGGPCWCSHKKNGFAMFEPFASALVGASEAAMTAAAQGLVDYMKRPDELAQTEPNDATRVGVDIVVQAHGMDAETLAASLPQQNAALRLKILSQKGVRVWPKPAASAQGGLYSCRYVMKDGAPLTDCHLSSLLQECQAANVHVVMHQSLYFLDERLGFSLAHGE